MLLEVESEAHCSNRKLKHLTLLAKASVLHWDLPHPSRSICLKQYTHCFVKKLSSFYTGKPQIPNLWSWREISLTY